MKFQKHSQTGAARCSPLSHPQGPGCQGSRRGVWSGRCQARSGVETPDSRSGISGLKVKTTHSFPTGLPEHPQ